MQNIINVHLWLNPKHSMSTSDEQAQKLWFTDAIT